MRKFACLVAILPFAATAALAQTSGDPAAGYGLAQKNCARCHNIERNGPFKLEPPSFAAIGTYWPPGQIEARIQFPAMHASMPQMSSILTVEEVKDLVAYIQSLDMAK